MKFRFYLLFTLFSLLFLFYPGDSHYYHIFAFRRDLFAPRAKPESLSHRPFPYPISQYPPAITADGAYIADRDTFTPVYQKNEHRRFLPASTTKIITALVSYDLYKLDDVIVVKQLHEDGQVMGLVEGEKITVENLLYGALVQSGNDAAFALAGPYGMDRFVEKMNEKAKQLSMNDSHFRNPAGLDAFDQQSSSYDLALAGRALLNNKYLSKIVSTKAITISDVDFKYFHKLTNVNKLLGELQGIGGLKTGFTEEAGENLVTLYKRKDGHEFIIVILKSLDRFKDTTNVVNWLETNVAYQPI